MRDKPYLLLDTRFGTSFYTCVECGATVCNVYFSAASGPGIFDAREAHTQWHEWLDGEEEK